MQRITSILIFLVCLTLLPATSATAGFFTNDTLVSIDENSYTVDDFKRWWNFWREGDQALPETPDPYIDWILLGMEAKRMGMDDEPGFKRQTRIFLQSRGLLTLKYNEVDSRIKVSDVEIKTRYEEQYQPRWLVQRLTFKDEETALAAWQDLTEETLTITELAERNSDQNGPVSELTSWLRPKAIDQKWIDIFQKLAVGEVAYPSEQDTGLSLYFLKEKKGADEEDFKKWREQIDADLWKEQENTLTEALLDKLREKYQVKVNEELLEALDIKAADDTFTDAAIITTNRKNISEKEFIAVLRRLMSSRPTLAHAAEKEEDARELKTNTVNNIIAQHITNWASLDQRFEEKEPFKWEYEFNYNHRLVRGLKNRLFSSNANITDEEIKQYYQENINTYTQPGMVNIYIIDETQGPLDKIWADVTVGKDFKQVLKENNLHKKLKIHEVPVSFLDKEVQPVVEKLTEGETSQIFKAQGIRVVVHLVKRTPAAPVPLERVKKLIHKKLSREKIDLLNVTFLDSLKSRSEIKIREKNWGKIQNDLGEVL